MRLLCGWMRVHVAWGLWGLDLAAVWIVLTVRVHVWEMYWGEILMRRASLQSVFVKKSLHSHAATAVAPSIRKAMERLCNKCSEAHVHPEWMGESGKKKRWGGAKHRHALLMMWVKVTIINPLSSSEALKETLITLYCDYYRQPERPVVPRERIASVEQMGYWGGKYRLNGLKRRKGCACECVFINGMFVRTSSSECVEATGKRCTPGGLSAPSCFVACNRLNFTCRCSERVTDSWTAVKGGESWIKNSPPSPRVQSIQQDRVCCLKSASNETSRCCDISIRKPFISRKMKNELICQKRCVH